MKDMELLINKFKKLGVRLWSENNQLHFKAPAGVLTKELKLELKENKMDIIEYLSQTEEKTLIHDESNKYEPFTLTPIQSSYLLGRNSIYEYGGVGCHAYVELKLDHRADIDRIKYAWHKVIMRHDMLRAIVQKEGIQRVLEDVKLPTIKTEYLVNVSEEDVKDSVLRTRLDMFKKKYESDVYPLHELRVTISDYYTVLHFSMDMLIADSISAGIILQDILHYYYEPEVELEPLDISFRDVVIFNESKLNTVKYQVKHENDMKYWKNRIDNFPEEPKLPLLANGEGRRKAEFDELEFNIDRKEWDKLLNISKEKKLTASSTILAAFAEVLNNWSSTNHFCINTTTMNRPNIHKQIYNVVGDFTQVNLLEINRDVNDTFLDSAKTIQGQLWTDLEHSDFNGIEVMRLINKIKKKQVFMPYVYTSTIGMKNLTDSRIDVLYKTSQTPQVFIDCQVSETEEGLSVIWCVRKEVFKNNIHYKMFKEFSNLITSLTKDNDTSWEAKYPCIQNPLNENASNYVSKDGIHRCNEGVIGDIYTINADGTSYKTNKIGRYSSDNINIEILGHRENFIENKGNIIYLDYCRDLLNKNSLIKDNIILKNNDSMNIYVLPEEKEETNNINFDSFDENNIDKELFIDEINSSDEFALITIMNLFEEYGLFTNTENGHKIQDIKAALNVQDQYDFLVKRWLNALCNEGYLTLSDDMYYGLKIDNKDRYDVLRDKVQYFISKDKNIENMAKYILSSGEHLKDIIDGTINPVDIFFPKGDSKTAFALYNENTLATILNDLTANAIKKIVESKAKKTIRILEVGAGTGATTDGILNSLENYDNIEYYFTDISNYFFKLASSRYEKYPWITFKLFDINKSPLEQNIDLGYFDIIISANVHHNAKDGNKAMKVLHDSLSPNGYMIFVDAIKESYSLLISKGILHNEEILDNRKDEDKIFYSDNEWLDMFNSNDLKVSFSYPADNSTLKAANLKLYVVKSNKSYEDIDEEIVYKTIEDEVGFIETINKLVISDVCVKDGLLDKNKIIECEKILNNSNSTSKNVKEEPRNELETNILNIWKEVLEQNSISINDNFFEVGGDSLLASMMVTKLRSNLKEAKELEWDKLMQVVLQNPTIKDIASILKNNDSEYPDFCIEYQKGSDTPNNLWVLFVNGTGTMAIYNNLLSIIKSKISPDDKIIGLHCGNFNEYINLPSDKVVETLAKRNCEFLQSIKCNKYNFIGHCFGGGVAIETAKNLNDVGIKNITLTTIDTRRWNVFASNALMLERGFGEMSGIDVSKCGHIVSDDAIEKALNDFIAKNDRMMTAEELCTSEDIDKEVRDCYAKLSKVPQDERLHLMFRSDSSDDTQEKQLIMLYKVFNKCFEGFMAFAPHKYQGKVDAIRCEITTSFFIPDPKAGESDYMLEAVDGDVTNYYVGGDHFTCLESPNVEKIAEVILKNM